MAATPAYAASTCSQIRSRAQTLAIAPTGSTLVDDVLPTVATTATGRTPARRSASIAPTSAQHWAIRGGRLFLNSNAVAHLLWKVLPGRIAAADRKWQGG
jgi:hypothetical protein